MIPQEDQLLGALHGRWSGEAGWLDIADDGTGRAEVRMCPLRPGNDRFGYSADCAPKSGTGHVSAGEFQIYLADRANNSLMTMSAYVDGSGQLHLSDGGVFAVTPQRQATLPNVDGSAASFAVDGDRCTRDDGSGPTAIACEWTTRDGQQILVIGQTVLVWDRFAGVLATPQAAFNVFRR